MRKWNGSGLPGVPAFGSWGHASRSGTIATRRDAAKRAIGLAEGSISRRLIRGEIRRGIDAQESCDKAASATAVMLHVRSRYVSKAAILTALVRSVPVENRSPA
jgi:hypothetical protein